MYTLIEVTTRQHETDFLELPVRLYKGNPWWIRPLDNDIRNVFDPAKNPCFQNGECIRWILKDEAGQCVGRVAAFINRKTCHLDKYSVGQMGFFECIDDRQAAFCLFDKCREWLEGKGMEAMEGPVNFGERIEWWGCWSMDSISRLFMRCLIPSLIMFLFLKTTVSGIFSNSLHSAPVLLWTAFLKLSFGKPTGY